MWPFNRGWPLNGGPLNRGWTVLWFFLCCVVYSGEYDVTLNVYPHRTSLKNMPGHGGNYTFFGHASQNNMFLLWPYHKLHPWEISANSQFQNNYWWITLISFPDRAGGNWCVNHLVISYTKSIPVRISRSMIIISRFQIFGPETGPQSLLLLLLLLLLSFCCRCRFVVVVVVVRGRRSLKKP